MDVSNCTQRVPQLTEQRTAVCVPYIVELVEPHGAHDEKDLNEHGHEGKHATKQHGQVRVRGP